MFNVIRYKTLANAPSGAFVAKDYAAYLEYFKSKGLDSYVKVFQGSYESMSQ